MNILAIDPAQRSGWAWSDGKQLHHGIWLLGSDPAKRLARLDGNIRAAVGRWATEVIAYESATFGSRHFHVMRRHNELAGVIQLVAAQRGIRCWAYPPTQWKAMALAHGHADKLAVQRLLQLLYDIDVAD
jgi:Holliday junction resolvasome RuvABC endonuclease subunit